MTRRLHRPMVASKSRMPSEAERHWYSDVAWTMYNHVREQKRGYRFVYFVTMVGDDRSPVKIGTTKTPSQRIIDLQVANWQRLIIERIVCGDRPTEQTLHQKWSEYCLAGEWFDPAVRVEILAVADNIARLQLECRWVESWFDSALVVDK